MVVIKIEKEYTEYLSRIRQSYDFLSASEKRIADYILEEKDNVANISINILAENTGTSPPTISRFCKTLGFKGYNELRFYIERELLSPAGEMEQINENDSIKVLKQKTFQFNKSVIDDTMMILDDNEVEKAVTAISNASKVELFGEGGSGSIALTAFNLFLHIGIPCRVSNDANLHALAASQLKRGDVAIGFAHSGNIRNTYNSMKIANEAGATTILITGNINSLIKEHSDIVLYASTKTKPFLSDLPAARISEICIIGILQVGVLTRNYDKYAGNVKKYKEILDVTKLK